jgi:hypothetical protein
MSQDFQSAIIQHTATTSTTATASLAKMMRKVSTTAKNACRRKLDMTETSIKRKLNAETSQAPKKRKQNIDNTPQKNLVEKVEEKEVIVIDDTQHTEQEPQDLIIIDDDDTDQKDVITIHDTPQEDVIIIDDNEVHNIQVLGEPPQNTNATQLKLPITGGRFVTTSTFNGNIMIHISQFADGKPVKGKGLALTLEQWVELVDCFDAIDTKICCIHDKSTPDFKHHLGSNKYVCVTTDFKCVDLRKFWLPDDSDEVVPTKKGIALSFREWLCFKKVAREVPNYVPDILTTVPCIQRDDHANQMGYWECTNCNPNFLQLELRAMSKTLNSLE